LGKDEASDLFGVADVEQVGVRGGQRLMSGAGSFGGDAVGQTDGAPLAVVAAGAKPTGGCANVGSDGEAVEQPELRQIEGRIFFVGSDDANQVVQDLGDADRGQGGVPSFQQGLDLSGGRFGSEEGNDGVGIEDGQGPGARTVSS
jgi:hypothetical protein